MAAFLSWILGVGILVVNQSQYMYVCVYIYISHISSATIIGAKLAISLLVKSPIHRLCTIMLTVDYIDYMILLYNDTIYYIIMI